MRESQINEGPGSMDVKTSEHRDFIYRDCLLRTFLTPEASLPELRFHPAGA